MSGLIFNGHTSQLKKDSLNAFFCNGHDILNCAIGATNVFILTNSLTFSFYKDHTFQDNQTKIAYF